MLGDFSVRSMLTKSQFDLMCLCETFLDINVADDEISIAGYFVETRHRTRHGGGVLVSMMTLTITE